MDVAFLGLRYGQRVGLINLNNECNDSQQLKRDYIPGLGDTADLVVFGASWEKERGRMLEGMSTSKAHQSLLSYISVPPNTWTTFHVGAIDKDRAKVWSIELQRFIWLTLLGLDNSAYNIFVHLLVWHDQGAAGKFQRLYQCNRAYQSREG